MTKRTHTCGELRREHTGTTATLNGWVHGRRDLGGMIFIDLRDRYGVTQVVFEPHHAPEACAAAKELRPEFVVSVTGVVRKRPAGSENPRLSTGDIEILADRFEILNRSEVPPFEIRDDVDANEDLRLKYRYLDLRRPVLMRNLLLRHKVYQVIHRYFDGLGFVEIETPVLMKSTPEGARDYLVPSRVHPGKFYALPQSPQTYKQLLMVAGFDRYVQVVKCFRDEDLRADRQPEFTQIDLEMAFVTREDVFAVVEGLVERLLAGILGVSVTLPFERMHYDAALERYGTDKPDTRFGMELHTLTDIMRGTAFTIFAAAVEAGGIVTGMNVRGGAGLSRKQLDALNDRAKALGLGGLVWVKVEDGGLHSPAAKFLEEGRLNAAARELDAAAGDLLLLAASPERRKALTALGTLRLELGRERGLIDTSAHRLLWVVDFPLFQYDEESGRWVAEHHPFTGLYPSDVPMLDKDPGAVRADCYDLVWNGNEIGSGSIRIHDAELQRKVFRVLGLSEEEIRGKFGFLIEAFRYGAPPHGGIALGLDRIVAILAGTPSIRDVIAFPKTNSALSLMDGAPSEVSAEQLRELHIAIGP
ncbi:MAG: aspartate--tRNA ligase [Bacteroidota bacterium]|nr:aspartate--tRNA ligase [Bacteroidota bacterium]